MKAQNPTVKRFAKNAGRKRGGLKGARTLDEALYAHYHGDAIFIAGDTLFRLHPSRIPHDPEERDPMQEEALQSWQHYVGARIVEALLGRDAALFEGIGKILRENPPDENGDWKAVHPARARAATLALAQSRGDRGKMTRKEVEAELLPFLPPCGEHRRTIGRIIADTGIQIKADKRGRPPKKRSR